MSDGVCEATVDLGGIADTSGNQWAGLLHAYDFHHERKEDTYDAECEASNIYEEMRFALYGYVQGLGLGSEAEDVIQETFYRLLRELKRQEKIAKTRAWIFQVAYNISMDIHRWRNRAGFTQLDEAGPIYEYADRWSNPEWVLLQKERAQRIRSAMSHLTERQLRSVQLRIKGLRYCEIAADLQVSEQRATYLVKRALARLNEV